MKKKLNIDAITNELKGGSAFFPDYAKSDSPTQPEAKEPLESNPTIEYRKETTPRHEVTPVRPVPPVRAVLPVPATRNERRYMKQRHPFDIYHDQYDSLKELSLEERMAGGLGSMSAMVREAIDLYIAGKKNTK